MQTHGERTPAAAWRQFGNTLADAADWVEQREMCQHPVVHAQGQRYVGRMAIAALKHQVEYADPLFPHMFRGIDMVNNWGGPNVDNEYLGAAIDPSRTYLLRGDVSGGARFLLQTIKEVWHLPENFAVLDDVSDEVFEPEEDGSIEIFLGGERQGRNWMPLHPEADRLWIRHYVTDWNADRPRSFTITRIDGAPLTPAILQPAELAAQIDRASAWLEGAVKFWTIAIEEKFKNAELNVLPTPYVRPTGSENIRYGIGFLDLEPEQCLLVEFAVPDSDYWSVQLYDVPWFEAPEHRDSLTSLNLDQLHVDADGIVRIAISDRDPGVRNWLDSSAVPNAMIMYRCVWARSVPDVSCTVVDTDQVRTLVPSAQVTEAERMEQLATRRRGAAKWVEHGI